jgi:hypothetical protein
LKPEGLLVIRNANRAFLAKIYYMLLKANVFFDHAEIPHVLIGDGIALPSIRGMRLLLEKVGFSHLVFSSDSGWGKKIQWQKRALYLLTHTLWIASYKKILFSPGIIVLARKTILDASH